MTLPNPIARSRVRNGLIALAAIALGIPVSLGLRITSPTTLA